MDDIDQQIEATKTRLAHMEAMVSRLQSTRMPAGRVLDAPSKARFDREIAAGQTEAPGVLDNLKTAVFGGKGMEGDNLGHDVARTARDVGSGVTFGLTDRLNPEMRAQETAEAPVASAIGKASGALLSSAVGPLAAAGKGAAGLLGLTERAVPALAKTALGRIAGQAAVGAGIGAGSGALEAVGAGGGVADAGQRALTGAELGALTGGGLQGVGEGGKTAFNAIRNSAGGKARELIEKYGGKAGLTSSGKGGAFEQELKGLPATDEGIGEAAHESGKRIVAKTDAIHERDVAEPYRTAKGPIDAGPGQRMADVDDVHQALMDVYRSPRLTVPQRESIKAEIDSFEAKYTGPHGVRVMSEKDLNDYKTMLNGLSKAGQAGERTLPQGMMSGAAKTVRDKVDQGPYAQLNKDYHEGMVEKSQLRQGLGLNAKESSNEMSDVNRVRNVLARQGQNSVTAGATTSELEGIKQAYPELARDIELPSLLGAKGDLAFRIGNPVHGGLVNRIKHEGITGLAGYGLGALAGGHGPLATGLTVGTSLAHANAGPLAGRVLYGPARALSLLGTLRDAPQLPGFIPEIEQAYLEAKARLGR